MMMMIMRRSRCIAHMLCRLACNGAASQANGQGSVSSESEKT